MDSKISQLPAVTAIYDHDLAIVVTGYGVEGAYPDNVKISLSQIRHDIIRLDEMIYLVSGFSGYYNEINNTMTITSHQYPGNLLRLDYGENWPHRQIISITGLNAVAGNHIELQFATGTPSSNAYGKTGGPYYSGIISVTGLNAYAGNRIFISGDSSWPHSGIISTTGLNATFGNGISYSVNTALPHTYDVRTVDRVKHVNSSTTVYNTGDWYSVLTTPATTMGSNLSINDMYGSKNYSSSVKVLVTAMFKINSITLEGIPSVTYGVWDARRTEELSHLTGSVYNFNYYGPCSVPGDANTRSYNNGSITWTTGNLATFTQTNAEYIDNSCTLTIGISGGGSLHNSTISPPLSFVNYESPYFRSDNHMLYLQNKDINVANVDVTDGHSHTATFADSPYMENANIRVGSIEPIILRTVVTLYNTDANAIANNSIGLYATLSNVRYQRYYQSASLANSYNGCSSTSPVYYTTSVYGYAKTNATISCQILKIEHIV